MKNTDDVVIIHAFEQLEIQVDIEVITQIWEHLKLEDQVGDQVTDQVWMQLRSKK